MSDNRRGMRSKAQDSELPLVKFVIDEQIEPLTLAWSAFSFVTAKGNINVMSLYLPINHDYCVDNAIHKAGVHERDILECHIEMVYNTGKAVNRKPNEIKKWKIKKS